MRDGLYSKLALPDSCYLGKKVYKKLILEHGECAARDKKSIRDDIDSISWLYTLKPSTIQIPAYQDESCEYLEIAILEVILKKQLSPRRLAEIIHRSIPYPLLLLFRVDPCFAISTAPKRFSQAEKGAVVADDFYTTHWIDTTDVSMVEESFLNSMSTKKLPDNHLLDFYYAWIQRIVALDCARLTGVFRLESDLDEINARREKLKQCHALETQIIELRSKLHKEQQFAVKVDLNTRIKRLEQDLKHRAGTL